MHDDPMIRETQETDTQSLGALYQAAFPDEILFPLVTALLEDKANTRHLCAVSDSQLVGHVAFSRCYVSSNDDALALLGPLAVLPNHQRKGIGSRLVEEGFHRLKKDQITKVLVLGDPDYYGRFGFKMESTIQPAYPIPESWQPAWQSFALTNNATFPVGALQVPKAWQQPALWSD